MHFIDENGAVLGLVEASALGLPSLSPKGVFAPASDGDLRPAVYAPDSSYSEAAASAVAALFSEDIDPVLAARLTERAFSRPPAIFGGDEDIIVADYRSGPSACAADIEADFLVGLLAHAARKRGPFLLLADGSGHEGAALAEAASSHGDLRVALLYPSGQAPRGIRGALLKREGGGALLIRVEGDRAAIEGLVREAAGRSVAGMSVTAAAPASPARFAARIVNLAASFATLRKGAAGDLFMGVRAGDGLGFAACLWAWKLGLPLTGIILSVGEKGILGIDASGRRVVERFDAEYPGVIRSLALLQNVDRETALGAAEALRLAAGPSVDLGSAMTIAAARLALDAGLRGHARIVVPWGADPKWDAESTSEDLHPSAKRFDAEIGPSLAALERALTA
jgi:threonine synthase